MADLIRISISNPISPALKAMPQKVQQAVAKVVQDTSNLLFQRIVNDTPRDRGSAGGLSSRWIKTVVGDQAVITNDAPHANTIEFGGYPVIPNSKSRPNATGPGLVRGAATLGGYPPGPRTQIAPGGSPIMFSNVSRQAPKGMARQNLERIQDRFVFDLEEGIDQAFSDIAESGP